MYFLNIKTGSPYFNLALEEYLLKNKSEEYFILSINDVSVVSGKHQCIHREVNTRFITENNIPVLRRISGGGTVFHDHGNLNFCFIRNCEPGRQVDFNRHLQPVTGFLSTLGVTATIEGSDLKMDGLKISGNAEHVYRNRVLHHGTLLWNASIDTLRNCLRKDTTSYKTRAVASRPSPVSNLSETVGSISEISGLRNAMLDYFRREFNGTDHHLTDEEKNHVMDFSEKYRTWEWNHAYGPEYEFSNEFFFRNRRLRCILGVRNGIIEECSFDGSRELDGLSEKLKGCRHMPEDVGDILAKRDIDKYMFF